MEAAHPQAEEIVQSFLERIELEFMVFSNGPELRRRFEGSLLPHLIEVLEYNKVKTQSFLR